MTVFARLFIPAFTNAVIRDVVPIFSIAYLSITFRRGTWLFMPFATRWTIYRRVIPVAVDIKFSKTLIILASCFIPAVAVTIIVDIIPIDFILDGATAMRI
jgi:hypothetical protein